MAWGGDVQWVKPPENGGWNNDPSASSGTGNFLGTGPVAGAAPATSAHAATAPQGLGAASWTGPAPTTAPYAQGWDGTSWTGPNAYTGEGMAQMPQGWESDQRWNDIVSDARRAADASGYPVGSYEWGKAYNDMLALKARNMNEFLLNQAAGQAAGMIPDAFRQQFAATGPYTPTQEMYMRIPEAAPQASVAPAPGPEDVGITNREWLFNHLANPLLRGESEAQRGLGDAEQQFGSQGQNAPVGDNNTVGILNHIMAQSPLSPDAGLGEYYDNQRRILDEQLRAKMSAVGAYGSSAYADMLGEGLLNLGAQQARDEADFRAKAYGLNTDRLGLGATTARSADLTSGEMAGRGLDWAGFMRGLRSDVDDSDMERIGMASELATGADEGVLGQGGLIARGADMDRETTENFYNWLISGDMDLMDQATMNALGVTRTDLDVLQANKTEAQQDMKNGMNLMDIIAKYKGK